MAIFNFIELGIVEVERALVIERIFTVLGACNCSHYLIFHYQIRVIFAAIGLRTGDQCTANTQAQNAISRNHVRGLMVGKMLQRSISAYALIRKPVIKKCRYLPIDDILSDEFEWQRSRQSIPTMGINFTQHSTTPQSKIASIAQ